jgi:hypothetical protein
MRLVDEIASGLDGLAQLRALIALRRKPSILSALDFEFVEIEAGRAVFVGTRGERAYNPIGTVHGGYFRDWNAWLRTLSCHVWISNGLGASWKVLLNS